MEPYGVIYLAKNLENGRVYIGQTVDMTQRKSKYRQRLKTPRSYFEQALAKYGMDGFEWTIIDRGFSPEELDLLEKKWIAHYKSNDKKYGYNMTDGGWVNRNYNQEARDAHSKRMKDLYKNGFVHPFKNKKMPQHIIDAVRAGRIAKYGNSSAMKGKKHTEKAKKKMSDANKGKHSSTKTEFPSKKVICHELNLSFPSLQSAARHFGGNASSLCCHLKKHPKYPMYKGYHWSYILEDNFNNMSTTNHCPPDSGLEYELSPIQF